MITFRKETPRLLHESPYAEFFYLPHIQTIYVRLKGYLDGKTYREQALRQIAYLKRYNVQKICYDLVNIGAISPADQYWTQNTWLPQALEVKLRYCAIVMPNDVFALSSVMKIMGTSESTAVRNALVKQRFFAATQDAYEWLEKAKKHYKSEEGHAWSLLAI
jgi:hypothetical protein